MKLQEDLTAYSALELEADTLTIVASFVYRYIRNLRQI